MAHGVEDATSAAEPAAPSHDASAAGSSAGAGRTSPVNASNAALTSAERGPRGSSTGKGAVPASSANSTSSSDAADEGRNDATIERFMRVLRGRLSKEGGQMTVRLDPPSLGKIRVHMDIQRDAVSLRIDADTHLAQRLLTEQSESLRAAVESAGLSLERLDIRPPEAERNQTNNDHRESGTWSDATGGGDADDRRAGERDPNERRAGEPGEIATDNAQHGASADAAIATSSLGIEPGANAGAQRGRLAPVGVNIWA